MSKNISIMLDVSIPDDQDPDQLAEKLFDFLTEDPVDLFPEILTVDSYDYKVG